ncbi:TolC family protein [Alishewanella sp. HL-SH06]|uniref:TolC family protein n=1 Tax=Alishewanella sp. HL-SH06 TaxID=3461144 RepID=UPI004042C656
MKIVKPLLGCCVALLVMLPCHGIAQMLSTELQPVSSLSQLTDAAEQRLQRQALHQPAPWISTWLADAPVLSAGLLNSRSQGGSDEIELALNLPLKSPSRVRLDEDVLDNQQRLTASLLAYRRWFASGLVRDTVWQIVLERKRQQLLTEQLDIYQHFIEKLRSPGQASEMQSYHQYLYQQGATELALEQLDSAARLLIAQQQLQQLTGQANLPNMTAEEPTADFQLVQHPRLQLLLLQEQQLQLQQQANSPANSAWQLTTRVKRVNNAEQNDNQIGLQLDIPLTIGEQSNQLANSTFQLDYQQWLNDYSDSQREIEQQHSAARTELKTQQAQLALLKNDDALRRQAKASLLLLLERQEINADVAQQRLQQLLQAELQLVLLEIQVQASIAKLNQTAGVML